jgi:hypothetical protein
LLFRAGLPSASDAPAGHHHHEDGNHEGPRCRYAVIRAVGKQSKHVQAGIPGGWVHPTRVARAAATCVSKQPGRFAAFCASADQNPQWAYRFSPGRLTSPESTRSTTTTDHGRPAAPPKPVQATRR